TASSIFLTVRVATVASGMLSLLRLLSTYCTLTPQARGFPTWGHAIERAWIHAKQDGPRPPQICTLSELILPGSTRRNPLIRLMLKPNQTSYTSTGTRGLARRKAKFSSVTGPRHSMQAAAAGRNRLIDD